MTEPRFQTFRILVLGEQDGILLELANNGRWQILIATDRDFMAGYKIYHQEAYGPFDFGMSSEEVKECCELLKAKLYERRGSIRGQGVGRTTGNIGVT